MICFYIHIFIMNIICTWRQNLFTQRIAGQDVKARSALEQKIWDMVSLVESTHRTRTTAHAPPHTHTHTWLIWFALVTDVYDRTKFPDAFNSMISINEAQTRSLAQHSKISLSEETLTVRSALLRATSPHTAPHAHT